MFGLFKPKKTIQEIAKAAEILPVAENGDYKAFMVMVLEKTDVFSSSLKSVGGQKGVQEFVDIIEDRILGKDFDDIFDVVDEMHRDYGTKPSKRNLNAERIVVCSDHNGYVFKWTP